jgi:hypothetical protein
MNCSCWLDSHHVCWFNDYLPFKTGDFQICWIARGYSVVNPMRTVGQFDQKIPEIDCICLLRNHKKGSLPRSQASLWYKINIRILGSTETNQGTWWYCSGSSKHFKLAHVADNNFVVPISINAPPDFAALGTRFQMNMKSPLHFARNYRHWASWNLSCIFEGF